MSVFMREIAVENIDGVEYEVRNIYKRKDGQVMIMKRETVTCKVVNRNGELSLVYFKEPLKIKRAYPLSFNDAEKYTFKKVEDVDRSRKFYCTLQGEALPKSNKSTLSVLRKSQKKSIKRATKNFYDLAISNDWKYFVTFTHSDRELRENRLDFLITWKRFIDKMKYRYPKITALGVYEKFREKNSNGYHYHFLIGGCNLRLEPAINANTGAFLYYKENQIFNVMDWKYGFTTAVKINEGSNNKKIVNYMFTKYMNKNKSAVPYGCKRFLKVGKLNRAFEALLDLSDKEISDIISEYSLYLPEIKRKKAENGILYYIKDDRSNDNE